MKKSAFVLPLLASLIIGACNNSDLHTRASTDSTTGSDDSIESPSTSTTNNTPKPAATCCFASIEEVKQFFPTGDAEIKISSDAPSGDLICQNDPETPSSVSCGYSIGNGKF